MSRSVTQASPLGENIINLEENKDKKDVAENKKVSKRYAHGNRKTDAQQEETSDEDNNEDEMNEHSKRYDEKSQQETTEFQINCIYEYRFVIVGGDHDGTIGGPDPDPSHKNEQNKKVLKEIGRFALKTAAMSGIILGGTALIVPAIGFGAAGVTAGSLAAAYQSAFLGGTIASGSAFATLQSIGAVGLSAAANSAVVAGSAAASGVHSFWKSKKKGSK